jgi:hypothetical protein
MTLALALLLVAVGSVQYEPASPTVGDPVTITYPDTGAGTLSVVPDDTFEIVDVSGSRAVVRSFRPGTIRVVAEILTPGQQTQRHSVEIEIRSVLAENDDLQPAPLVLPKPLERDHTPWWAIGIAAVAAALAWVALYFVSRRLQSEQDDDEAWEVDPASAFLERLNRIGRLPDEDERWRQLADSTRWLLPRIDSSFGRELTTSEILAAMRGRRESSEIIALIDRILHGGDLAKFSPFGAPEDVSTGVLAEARSLAGLVKQEEDAA